MRRKSTWAWRLRPLSSWPWVARRRLSWATTRCTAARSWIGPVGSARSSSFSGRLGGRLAVRSIRLRSSSRRRCCSKLLQLVSWDAVVARVVLGEVGLGLGSEAERAPDALHVDAEDAGALAAAERGDRQPGEVPERGVGAVSQRGGDLLAERVEVDVASAARRPCLGLGDAPAGGLGLGGAEEEAVEHELEHSAVVVRLGERGGQRLLEVALIGPVDVVQRLEGVEDLGGADRDALAAEVLGEGEELAVEGAGRLVRDAAVDRRVLGARRRHRPAGA